MFVRDKMTKDVVTISISDPLTKAQRLMQQNDFHHLPVLSGKKLTGVLSDSDIEYYLSDNSGADTKDLTVKDVLPPNKRCVTIAPNVSIEQAVMLLQNNKSGCLPVVEGESMVGIITLSDVLNTFIDLLWAKRSRITVELGPAPGLIADVADVISSFGVSILRIVMFPKGENFEALLSLDTDDTKPIVDKLREKGYVIDSYNS